MEKLKFQTALHGLRTVTSIKWTQGFRELLENKHIYQRLRIDNSEAKQQLKEQTVDAANAEAFLKCAAGLETDRLELRIQDGTETINLDSNALVATVSNLTLFCSTCGRREAFSPLWVCDLSQTVQPNKLAAPPFRNVQIFVLVFQCQRCLGAPHTFLIRRAGMLLMIEGRSPFENVEVPAYVPKPETTFYRDAVIAMHGGKTLAALFYLRTFIEQFARRVTGIKDRETGEAMLATYNSSLPTDLSDRMPSLREWYEKLSEAVHGAKEDADLFTSAKENIDKHLEIRRVFNIPEEMIRPAELVGQNEGLVSQ